MLLGAQEISKHRTLLIDTRLEEEEEAIRSCTPPLALCINRVIVRVPAAVDRKTATHTTIDEDDVDDDNDHRRIHARPLIGPLEDFVSAADALSLLVV